MQFRVIHVIDKSVHNQLPQESGSACHAGQLGFFVEDEFFIIAQIKDDLVFTGTVFVSVFVHFISPFLLGKDGFIGKYGWAFPLMFRCFCSVFWGSGVLPCVQKCAFPCRLEREFLKVAYKRNQCLLFMANLP